MGHLITRRGPERVTLALRLPVALIVAFFASSGAQATSEQHQERALLASLHRGMSRIAFYQNPRRFGVKPGSPDFVRSGPNGGPPIDNGDFPMPNAAHTRPMVSIFLFRPRIGCDVPTDEVDVYFDRHDRAKNWVTRRIITEACP
jgi:hypothetical protein